MRGTFAIACFAAAVFSTAVARAGQLSPDERAFFDKHVSDVIQIEPTKIDDPAVVKVFATPFYKVSLVVKDADGEMRQELILARAGDKLVGTSGGHTDADLPQLVQMFNPAFTLKTDADGKTLLRALETVYPTSNSDDRKLQTVKRSGKQWTVVRGKFFDSKMGYVFTTDAGGKITAAKYVMKLP